MNNLIGMYHNFALTSRPVYGGIPLEPTKPNAVKVLEISKATQTVELDEHFGRTTFWDAIEKVLGSKDRTFYDEL